MRDRSYKVTYSFLAVCTHEVPLYLCSIFSSRSLVQLRVTVFRAEHAPKCIRARKYTEQRNSDRIRKTPRFQSLLCSIIYACNMEKSWVCGGRGGRQDLWGKGMRLREILGKWERGNLVVNAESFDKGSRNSSAVPKQKKMSMLQWLSTWISTDLLYSCTHSQAPRVPLLIPCTN